MKMDAVTPRGPGAITLRVGNNATDLCMLAFDLLLMLSLGQAEMKRESSGVAGKHTHLPRRTIRNVCQKT